MIRKLKLVASLLVVGLAFVVGCGSGSTPMEKNDVSAETAASAPDPHDIPLTDEQKEALRQGVLNYADALAKIKSYRDAIREAVTAGTPVRTHQPLDELDVVLEHLPAVARDNNIPKTEWETVNTSAQALRESFNKLHAQIDAGEKPDYQSVAADIDSAIAGLETVPTSQ